MITPDSVMLMGRLPVALGMQVMDVRRVVGLVMVLMIVVMDRP